MTDLGLLVDCGGRIGGKCSHLHNAYYASSMKEKIAWTTKNQCKIRIFRPSTQFFLAKSALHYAYCADSYLALNTVAYILICFIMASIPFERVGERCSLNPILSMK